MGKVESCNRIRDGYGDEVQRKWKDYSEFLYNIDTQEQIAVNMCGLMLLRAVITEERRLERLKYR